MSEWVLTICTIVVTSPDQYWIGKATRMTKCNAPGSIAGTGGRVRYDASDFEVEVEWFHRDISGGDERRIFKRWVRDKSVDDPGPEEGTKYTFNSTQLRAINVKMQPVLPVGGVPLEVVAEEVRLRRSPRVLDAAQAAIGRLSNIIFSAHQQCAQPAEQLWEIPGGEESAILMHCCL